MNNRLQMKHYYAATSNDHSCIVEAGNPPEAAVKAVNRFASMGVEPWDLTHRAPDAPVPGYDFLLALNEDVEAGGRITANLYAGFRDETGEYSPWYGEPATLVTDLGECFAERDTEQLQH